MNWGFSEEQALFRESIRKFVKQEVLPRAHEIGNLDRIAGDLWKGICALGVIAMAAPEEYGGYPGDSITLGIAAEELGRGDASLAGTLIPNIGACILLKEGSEQLQKDWIPAIIGGEKLGCLALTETDCGTDIAALKTTAAREEDRYILRGEKTSIGWGAYADFAIVLAKTAPQGKAHGASCFFLPLDLPGIAKSPHVDMGLKPVGRASLLLDDVAIPSGHMLGQEGKGFSLLMNVLDLTRVLLSLVSLGSAEAAMDQTIGYVKQRYAFGKPIGAFEGVSFKIAEAATLLEAARLFCYRSLGMRDQGVKFTKEAAMCKWWSTRVAADAIHEAILLHGHYGYSAESLLERRFRDVVGHQLADGTPEGMKLIIVRELLGKEFLPF